MDWIQTFREPLLKLKVPDGWQIQLGMDEAYECRSGKWVELDSMEVDGRMLENEEIKFVPKIRDLHIVGYFIPRATLTLSGRSDATRLARHITITMRPYYKAPTQEDAMGKFWKEYGNVVAVLEDLNYELRNQDVDYIDDQSEYNFFIDTSFWKSMRDHDKEDVVQEFIHLAKTLQKKQLLNDPESTS